MFQSALPRGERHRYDPVHLRCLRVSIRAPARGATELELEAADKRGVSIRAPARGATRSMRWYISSLTFQSALPRGERREETRATRRELSVSIRAPARGATQHDRQPGEPARVSIRAPARGATRGRRWVAMADTSFQSALPRGERREGDNAPGVSRPVSIRAPARGATTNRPSDGCLFHVSIRAPARGATRGLETRATSGDYAESCADPLPHEGS